MDFASVMKAGSRLGTGTIIVLDDQTCPVGMVRSLEHFFAHESCGWCTPCREGLPWTARLLDALEEGRPGKSFPAGRDRKSTRLNSSHVAISYAVFCLKKKRK